MSENRKKIIYSAVFCLLFGAVFLLGVWFGAHKIAYCVRQPDTIDFSLFWDAYNKLKDNFIDPSKITNEKIIYGAIRGLTGSLEDPYTNFFDPNQAKKFKQEISGSFDGIGIEVGIKNGLLTVVAPLKGTPGEKAGLRAGDIILKIDGKETSGLTIDEAVNLIRGPKGTKVILTILRKDWTKNKEIEIIRDAIEIPSMSWSLLSSDGNTQDIAYIQIYHFGQNLISNFEKSAFEILQSPAKKIILDLRNNPGGYLYMAQNIAGWFLEKGQIVTIEDFGNKKARQTYKAEGVPSFINYPVVVLINQGSASASEILAAALRDNRGVKLIGEKSFGKGSLQEVIDLKDGSFLKITVADWLTPKGNSISKVGLTPDIKVDITDKDIEQGHDPQLARAIEIIKDLK